MFMWMYAALLALSVRCLLSAFFIQQEFTPTLLLMLTSLCSLIYAAYNIRRLYRASPPPHKAPLFGIASRVLLINVVVCAIFYHKLPSEGLASTLYRATMIMPICNAAVALYAAAFTYLLTASGKTDKHLRFESMVAFRYLRSLRGSALSLVSLIALCGVVLGVSLLIVSLSILSGFEADLIDKIIGAHAHITLSRFPGYRIEAEDLSAIQKSLSNFKQVRAHSPFVQAEVLVASDSNHTEAHLYGVRPKDAPHILNVFNHLHHGQLLNSSASTQKLPIGYHLPPPQEIPRLHQQEWQAEKTANEDHAHNHDKADDPHTLRVMPPLGFASQTPPMVVLPEVMIGLEMAKQLHVEKFEGQQGIWSNYVETHLLPRLNGFELLMASYAMAHLKLDLLLNKTGYKPIRNQRFRVYLTNSLEEHHPDTGTLFANWLSIEANEANYIKRDTPVIVVIGNPPYSGESANKSGWIMRLMEDYKKEPGGKEKLNERNPKWINDDYVKFLRYGQHFIEKNGSGVLAFINPHGFLDNPTFRGMRWNLLKTYDKIYVIDLHGNSKKKETAPDGTADANVFDIQQGVSINIFIKTAKKKSNELGQVFHFDLFGKRQAKYDFLMEKSIRNIEYAEIENLAPNYYFVQKNFNSQKAYNKGFQISELFSSSSIGIVTAKDVVLVNNKKENLILNVENHFHIKSYDKAIQKIAYRPFDNKYIYYDTKIIERPREKLMRNFLDKKNLGLIYRRQQPDGLDLCVFCSDKIIADGYIRSDNKGGESIAPLYYYPEYNEQQAIEQSSALLSSKKSRAPNLNEEILKRIAEKLSLTFTDEKEATVGTFAPIDVFDYIYAVLYSPTYREKYKEFLKIDFPRVPYPNSREIFWQLVKLGGELRQIHLLESPIVEKYMTQYPVDGNNIVGKIKYEKQKVHINDNQYFDNVPEIAWNFYIGGYQPAQKWLKDRKERELNFDDILHYQKIIVALFQTDKLMNEIDKIDFNN